MPGIFISYRRNESAGHAGRLFDRLTSRFGEDRVFMDVDTLVPSDRFATRIEKAIATADVMLVLIGPTWVAQADRLAQPDDFIRREILAALRVECRLVPVCLDGAAIPAAATLPEDLQPLLAQRRRRAAARRVRPRRRPPRRFAGGLRASLGRGHPPLPVGGARPAGWPRPGGRRGPPHFAEGGAGSRGGALALVWALTVAGAWWQGQQGEADDFTQLQVTDNAIKATAGFLNGTVTDEVDRTVEDAVVTLSNLDAQRNTETTTDSSGEFTIAY